MAFVRPEVTATLRRWREVLTGIAVGLAGLWIAVQGGALAAVAGAAVVALGAGLAVIGRRRLRFTRAVDDPGVVQVVEGQIGYFGPAEGGFAGLSAITEIALVDHDGRRCWRLSQQGGERLFVPVAAQGAEALFDAFAGLPGLEVAALIAAVESPPGLARIVWRRRHPARRRLN